MSANMHKEDIGRLWHWFERVKPYLILTIIPLLFTLLFGGAFSPVANSDVPVIIYDMDGSNESRQLVDFFAQYPYLNITESAGSMADIEDAMLSGRALGAVIVPDGFGHDLQTQSGAELLVMQEHEHDYAGGQQYQRHHERGHSAEAAGGRRRAAGAGQTECFEP